MSDDIIGGDYECEKCGEIVSGTVHICPMTDPNPVPATGETIRVGRGTKMCDKCQQLPSVCRCPPTPASPCGNHECNGYGWQSDGKYGWQPCLKCNPQPKGGDEPCPATSPLTSPGSNAAPDIASHPQSGSGKLPSPAESATAAARKRTSAMSDEERAGLHARGVAAIFPTGSWTCARGHIAVLVEKEGACRLCGANESVPSPRERVEANYNEGSGLKYETRLLAMRDCALTLAAELESTTAHLAATLAENARLERHSAGLRMAVEGYDEIKLRLEAENAALREALEKLLKWSGSDDSIAGPEITVAQTRPHPPQPERNRMNISEAAKEAAKGLRYEPWFSPAGTPEQAIQSAIDTELASRDALIAAKDEALAWAFEALEQYGPTPGHQGSCGPESGCDGLCVEAALFAEQLHKHRAAQTPDIAARFVPVEERDAIQELFDESIDARMQLARDIGCKESDTVSLFHHFKALIAERDELALKLEEATIENGVLKACLKTPATKRIQPCGCIVCICEDEERCHGCGAKSCGTPECVFRGVTHRIEYDDAPTCGQLRAQLAEAERQREKAEDAAHDMWLDALGKAKLIDVYSSGETAEETIGHICSKIADERDAALARLASAEKDSARLDWLEKNPTVITKGPICWYVANDPNQYPTLRAAIDSATK